LRTAWDRGWLPGWLLIAATIFAYQPAWHAGFIWDDDRYVTNNRLLTAPDGLWRIWFSTDSPSQYFPLVYTALLFERAIWGLDPAGYHWVNILLHAVNAMLVWRLLRRLEIPGSWLAAALFALHPVQVETVAWISEQKNVLSLLFSLLAMLAWTEFIEAPKPQLSRSYGRILLFYVLALLSKSTACMLPAALLLILWLKHKPINRARLLQVGPFVALGVGMGLLAMWWERHHQGTEGKIFALGLQERILIASRAVWFYLGKLVWPANLTFSYPRWAINPTDTLAYVWLAAGAVMCSLIYFARRFFGRSVEVAAAYYVATLGPLLGCIMLYTFRYTFVADHYQYAACIGPMALIAAGITVGIRRMEKRIAYSAVGCGALLMSLSLLTWRQCGMYADAEILWRTTIARNPTSYMAHNNLGNLLTRKGKLDEAIKHFQLSFAIQPDYAIAHHNLGRVLIQKGQLDEAATQFKKAVELDPDYAPAHINLANALMQKGQVRGAISHYEAALSLRLKSADVYNNLAWLLATCPDASLRDGPRAVELAQQANRLTNGSNPVYLGTLAAAQAEAGLFPEAVNTAQRALELTSSQFNGTLASVLRAQIELYQAGTPFRDASHAVAPISPDQP